MVLFDYLGDGILLLILALVFYGHYSWFHDKKDKWSRFIIIASLLIFVIIFIDHIVYVKTKHNKPRQGLPRQGLSPASGCLPGQGLPVNTTDISKTGIIDFQNKAMHLMTNLSHHPIFYAMEHYG